MSAEDVGSYVRERCASEFAEHRKLTSRLSSLTRRPSSVPEVGLEATAIRRTPEPAAMVVAQAAPLVAAAAPAPVPPQAPAPGPKSRVGVVVALVLVLLLVLGLGVWGGMHLRAGPAAETHLPEPARAAEVAVQAPASTAPVPAATTPSPAAAVPPPTAAEAEQPASPPPARPAVRKAVVEAKHPVVRHAAKKVEPPAPPVVAPPPPPPPLVAEARIKGAGPWKRMVISNLGTFRWTKCELRLPDNRHASLDRLAPHDSESINMMKFKDDGDRPDVPLDWLSVRCAEGTAKVTLP